MKALKSILSWSVVFSIVVVAWFTTTGEELNEIQVTSSNILRKQELLHRLKSLPAKEEAIRQKLESLSNVAAAKYLYAGDQRSTQTVMQRDMRQLAANAGIQLGSMRTLGISNEVERLKRASIQANFITTNDKLLDLLSSLEAWEPMLRVQRISVRVRQVSTIERQASLAVMLEIAGFHQQERPSS